MWGGLVEAEAEADEKAVERGSRRRHTLRGSQLDQSRRTATIAEGHDTSPRSVL